MDTQDLQILSMLSELGSIKAVGDALYLTQPAVSYRIKKLEDEFGIQLLIRESKGVTFTPQGEHLVEYAKKNLEELHLVKETLHNFSSEIQGTLRLGVANNFAHYKLPLLLKSFLAEYPKVKIKLHTGLSPEIMDLMRENKIDIGIENCGYKWTGEKELLCREGICLISFEKINLENLHKYSMISTKRNHVFQQMITTWFRDNFKNLPKTMMEVDFIDTCKVMVENGLGIAIVPSFCLTRSDHLYVRKLQDRNGDHLFREIYMNYKKENKKLAVVEKFLEHIRKHQKILEDGQS